MEFEITHSGRLIKPLPQNSGITWGGRKREAAVLRYHGRFYPRNLRTSGRKTSATSKAISSRVMGCAFGGSGVEPPEGRALDTCPLRD